MKLNGATVRARVNIQHNENLKTSYTDKIIPLLYKDSRL